MNVQLSARGRAEHAPHVSNTALCGQAFDTYIAELDAIQGLPAREIPRGAAAALENLLEQPWQLPRIFCEPDDLTYRRHVLYVDPQERFTVLSLVWCPGQATPVHGHTAWGVVGVYTGNPSVENFQLQKGQLESLGELQCEAGDVCFVEPGTEQPHRVFNASDALAVTIHTYGRNLVDDPASINILV